jgi:hypothetical protein
MSATYTVPVIRPPRPSPLVLSDRLLNLAEDADLAGCPVAAEHLLALAHSVFDEASSWTMPPRRKALPGARLGAPCRRG